MRISITFGGARNSDWEGATDFVVEAERLGVHDVWSAEAWGYDAVTPLAYLARYVEMLHTIAERAGHTTAARIRIYDRG